jgi:hypothetical protein
VAHPGETKLFTQIHHPKKRAFLLAFTQCGQITHSCRAAEMDHCMHYYWLKTDAAYVHAFAEAQTIAGRLLEEEAIRRARDGVKRTIYHQGEPVGEETVYSDTLLIFLMKGAMPAKYRERIEHTGDHGGPLTLKVVYEDAIDVTPEVPLLEPPQC